MTMPQTIPNIGPIGKMKPLSQTSINQDPSINFKPQKSIAYSSFLDYLFSSRERRYANQAFAMSEVATSLPPSIFKGGVNPFQTNSKDVK